MAAVDPSLTGKLRVFAEEFHRLVQPARNDSIISVMKSIDPQEMNKQTVTGSTLGKDYSREVFSSATEFQSKLFPQTYPTLQDLKDALRDLDSILHKAEGYLKALEKCVENSCIGELHALDCLNSEQIQLYCEFEGNYNDFLRRYMRFRLKLNQEYSLVEPSLTPVKDICSLKYK